MRWLAVWLCLVLAGCGGGSAPPTGGGALPGTPSPDASGLGDPAATAGGSPVCEGLDSGLPVASPRGGDGGSRGSRESLRERQERITRESRERRRKQTYANVPHAEPTTARRDRTAEAMFLPPEPPVEALGPRAHPNPLADGDNGPPAVYLRPAPRSGRPAP